MQKKKTKFISRLVERIIVVASKCICRGIPKNICICVTERNRKRTLRHKNE